MTQQLAKPLNPCQLGRAYKNRIVTRRNMVSREFPSKAFVQYHITAATPPSGLKHGSLKIAGSQRVQPTTDVECIFFHHLLLSAFHSPPYLQEVQLKIREEFLRTKTDPECQEAYSDFQYLHEKLDHIKKLVHNYDQERLGKR